MTRTPLYDQLAGYGARFAEYRGAETAAAFSDPAREWEALRSGCALYDLGWQSHLAVSGEDRQRWLNGMVTNNIRDLELNRGLYCFLLSAQGRIQGDMYVYNRGDRMIIETDAGEAQKLREIFERFIIMDDVELSAPQPRNAIGLAGPKAEQTLDAAGIDVSGMNALEVRQQKASDFDVEVVLEPRARHKAYEVSGESEALGQLWQQLTQAGATPAGTDVLELWRIAQGVPRYGQDISERYLPQETDQTQALHFSKGCYVGQEIVERIRSRGQVHRLFSGFALQDAQAEIVPGSKVQRKGKDIGEITSVALLPARNGAGAKKVALGYIRREERAPGTEVLVNGATAVVSALPFE